MWITTNWKILKEMGTPDHLICLLRNLYAGQEATVRNDMDQGLVPNWERSMSRLLSPCSFNLNAEYFMQNGMLEEAQAGIKVAGRNINNLRYGRKQKGTNKPLHESGRGE